MIISREEEVQMFKSTNHFQFTLRTSSPFGVVARSHGSAARERDLRPWRLRGYLACSLVARFACHNWRVGSQATFNLFRHNNWPASKLSISESATRASSDPHRSTM